MSIQKFFTSRSPAAGNLFVGQEGRLWFDSVTHIIYYSDGATPGGIPITSNLSIIGGSGITTLMSGNVVTINAKTTFESLSKNIKSYPYALVRTGSTITSVQYTTPSTDIITKTLNYTSGKISSISITGIPLANVVYTKTLAYSGADITGASYSII